MFWIKTTIYSKNNSSKDLNKACPFTKVQSLIKRTKLSGKTPFRKFVYNPPKFFFRHFLDQKRSSFERTLVFSSTFSPKIVDIFVKTRRNVAESRGKSVWSGRCGKGAVINEYGVKFEARTESRERAAE